MLLGGALRVPLAKISRSAAFDRESSCFRVTIISVARPERRYGQLGTKGFYMFVKGDTCWSHVLLEYLLILNKNDGRYVLFF